MPAPKIADQHNWNVLYVCSTAEHGGANIQLMEMLKKINLSRYKPLIITPPPEKGTLLASFEALGVRLERLKMSIISAKLYNPVRLAKFCPGVIIDVVHIIKLIQRKHIELVHVNAANALAAGIASKLCGVPCVWQVHEILTPKIVRFIVNSLIVLLANKIVVISKPVAKVFPHWAQRKIEIIHDGVDVEKFHPAISGLQIRKELGIPSESPVIGMVGRFVPRKGHRFFLKACAKVAEQFPEAHFVMVGQTFPAYANYLEEIRQLVDDLDLSSKMHFAFWRTDMPEVTASLNIAVLASTLPEGFGLVMIEAMAMGKPVVATKVGGVTDIVTEDVGCLVPPSDDQAMASAFIELLSDKEMSKRRGEAGRKRILNDFTSGRAASQMEKVYHSLLKLN